MSGFGIKTINSLKKNYNVEKKLLALNREYKLKSFFFGGVETFKESCVYWSEL